MAIKKMHDEEVDISETLVRQLLGAQFPEWSDRPLTQVHSIGTVNAIYRLGDDLCVRLPRVARMVGDLEKELEWLPWLAGRVSVTVPVSIGRGEAGFGYPFTWAIYRWIDGQTFETDRMQSELGLAIDLVQFVKDLRAVDPAGAPSSGRLPLRQLDQATRWAIGFLHDVVDTGAVSAAWEVSLGAAEWDGLPCWRHCDLLPPNLLVEGGRLKAVIDFGSAGVGDPALDVIAAWSVFGEEGRRAFREGLEVDDGTWARARGFALHQAVFIMQYYPKSNPGFVTMAQRTVDEILGEMRF